MYNDSQIIEVARDCHTVEEVMAAGWFFRLLIATGLQPPSPFLSQVLIMRFREVT